VITLKNWYIGSSPKSMYEAPELERRYLIGTVFGHPQIDDGETVCTSTIAKIEGNQVTTCSGTVYVLFEPSEKYVQHCLEEGWHIPSPRCPFPSDPVKIDWREPLFIAALQAGCHEVKQSRKTMLLTPTCSWSRFAASQRIVAGVHLRASTFEPGLKSLPLDTLILVSPSDPEWNKKGEMYARERLGTSLEPRVIVFDTK